MNIVLTWERVEVEIQGEPHVASDGAVYENVLTKVTWIISAVDTDSEESVEIEGELGVPPPESPEEYVDLNMLQNLPLEEKPEAVRQVANRISPEMLRAAEFEAKTKLKKKLGIADLRVQIL